MSCEHLFTSYEIDEGIWKTVSKWALTSHLPALDKAIALNKRNTEIVARIRKGEKRYMLAAEYGLATSTVSYICTKAGLPKKVRYTKEKL